MAFSEFPKHRSQCYTLSPLFSLPVVVVQESPFSMQAFFQSALSNWLCLLACLGVQESPFSVQAFSVCLW